LKVNENLRRLRLSRGLTQEQVAEKIGITRQALSGYESGRTRPDIDMLMRLSEVYETDMDAVLYGQSRELKNLRRVNITAKLLFAILSVLTVVSSAFLWSANRFYALSEGPLSPEEMLIFETRRKLMSAWELTDGLVLTCALIGLVLLLAFFLSGRCTFPLGTKLRYIAVLSAVILAAALLFGFTDPVFSVIDYLITPLRVIGRFFLFLIAELIAGHFRRRKERA